MSNILLIDTTSRNLHIAAYGCTKNIHNQLVLRHAGNFGCINSLKDFDSKDFHIAVTRNNYFARSSEGNTMKFFPHELQKTETVSAILENKIWNFRPLSIHIFPNNMYMYSPVKASGLSDKIMNASFQLASLKGEQGNLVVGEGESNYFNYKEFLTKKNSKPWNLNSVPDEYQEHIFNSNKVIWTYVDNNLIYYFEKDIVLFNQEWLNEMEIKLNTVTYDNALLPTIEGSWGETTPFIGSGYRSICAVEGRSFPMSIIGKLLNEYKKEKDTNAWLTNADKDFWKWTIPKIRKIMGNEGIKVIYNKKIREHVLK